MADTLLALGISQRLGDRVAVILDHVRGGRNLLFSSHQLDLVEDLPDALPAARRGPVVPARRRPVPHHRRGLGALVERQEEAGTVITPLTLLLVAESSCERRWRNLASSDRG